MPTEPLRDILYRDLSKVEAKSVIEVACPLVRELVNYGTHALMRCANSTSRKEDEDLAVLALYRHLIEITDGIEVLISQSCPTPAIPLLRSSFEAVLSMQYMVENDQEYLRRSLAWLVCYVHQRLDMYDRLDPATRKGRYFRTSLQTADSLSRIRLPPTEEVLPAKARLDTLLEKPHLRAVEAEFGRHKGTPRWYQLFGGPQNLRALARHLNRGAEYEFLYRYWPRTAHAQDLLPFIAVGRLRDPTPIRETATFASSFLLQGTKLALGKFRPGEDLGPWYTREVRPLLRSLGALPTDRLT